MTEYIVLVHEAEEGGYWCEVPSLPGCFAQGETMDDVLLEAKDAIRAHLEGLEAFGGNVEPQPLVRTVAVV